ncbi:hypothetical protein A2U01_0111374, partial [Trifolium medium]|nr:hypothetical protein [Trifolium medium]
MGERKRKKATGHLKVPRCSEKKRWKTSGIRRFLASATESDRKPQESDIS